MKKFLLAFTTILFAAQLSHAAENKVPNLVLNNGVQMPQFGLGTYKLADGDEAYQAVLTALKNGYRHIDTAHAYLNERSVGRAIKDSGIPREEIWVTSKIWPTEYPNAAEALDKVLNRLGLDYLDLIYLHQPVGEYKKAWEDMIQAQKDGKVRAIGISNFDKVEEIFDDFMVWSKVKPQIMQLECHPHAQRKHWQQKLKEHHIVQENWFPLGGRESHGAVLNDPVLNQLAKQKGKSAAQIIIRWHIQEGFSVVPGASDLDYIKENIDVFDWELTDDEMETIRHLDKEHRYFNPPFEEQQKTYLNITLPD